MKKSDLKYEVGDKVRIISDLKPDIKYSCWTINSKGRMNYLAGQIVEIKSIVRKAIFKDDNKTPTGKYNYGYSIDGYFESNNIKNNTQWLINDDMIKEKIIISGGD